MTYEDLPLFPETDPGGRAGRSKPEAGRPASSPPAGAREGGPAVEPTPGAASDHTPARTSTQPSRVPSVRPRWRAARFAERVGAGLVDCVVLLGAAVIVALGALLAGADLEAARWAPLALFLIAFSFVYTVVPLAFWGQTPGMALLAIVARRPGQAPLSFRQAALRWLAGWLTVLLAGLPVLLALTGASLADRLSGSATLRRLT